MDRISNGLKIVKISAVELLLCSICVFANDYLWPTNASHYLTSSFAESRPGRFHAGIDIKTWGREGYEIYAIRNGYISRIQVSPFGYGRALYLTLDTGEIVVYGHLKAFSSTVEEYVYQQQLQQGKYSVRMYPPVDRFEVKKGDLLGYTGQTGVGYPHLHFEMRDPGNRPINPFSRGYEVRDTIAPQPSKIAVTPLDAYSQVNGDWKPVVLYPVYSASGRYIVPDTIFVNGRIGFGVDAFDMMNDVTNKFGTYTNQLYIDEELVFSASYDRFSYDQNNQANLDRDFRLYARGFGRFYKLYRDIGNDLPFYQRTDYYYGVTNFTGDEWLDVPMRKSRPGEIRTPSIRSALPSHHAFRIVLKDFWGNSCQISGNLFSGIKSGIVPLLRNTQKPLTGPNAPFSVDTDYYDNYVRIELTASQQLKGEPELVAWTDEGSAVPIKLVALSPEKFIGCWPLTEGESGPVPIEISFSDIEGRRVYQKEWLNFTSVAKGHAKKITTQDGLCSIEFNPQSLFRSIFIRTSVEQISINGRYDFASSEYFVEPADVPLDKGATISIRYAMDDSLPEKLGVYHKNSNQWIFSGNRVNVQKGTVSCSVSGFGSFSLVRDIDPPVILSLFPGNGQMISTDKPVLRAVFKDNLSGIGGEANMEMTLDGYKVIAEYDPEKILLFYQVRQSLTKGRHEVEIRVRDQCGNQSSRNHIFTVL